MIDEIWKRIDGFKGNYEVSNYGRVRSLNYNRKKEIKILKPLTSNGYSKVVLYGERSKRHSKRIHQLVWEYFGDQQRTKQYEVDHIDGDRKNNFIGNLRLLTQRVNIAEAFQRRGKILPTGVTYNSRKRRYVARITFNRKTKNLGLFRDPELARQAYLRELSRQTSI